MKYLNFLLLIPNNMEQNPSWEANSWSISEEIPSTF
jgi:hypothetical protein